VQVKAHNMLGTQISLIAASSLVACACWLSGCSPIAGQWQFREVNRVKSPGGEVDAVLVVADAGATTSQASLVILVAANQQVGTTKPKEYDVVFRADHLKNLHVIWKQPQLLDIQYDEARISQFKNLWEVWGTRTASYAVEVRLDPMTSDFSVPLEDRMSHPVLGSAPAQLLNSNK